MLVVAALLLAGGDDGPGPQERLDAFLTEWSRGADRAAAQMTSAPVRAAAALRANRAGLDGARLRARRIGEVRERDGIARGRVRMSWDVPAIGEFAYTTTVALRRGAGGAWTVRWTPRIVHPRLTAPGERLGTVRTVQRRGRILDRDGVPLVQAQPVKRIGAIAGQVDDPAATAAAIADAVEIDPRPFARALRAAGPQQFVEAITLRVADYEAVAATLEAIPGAEVVDGTAHLAPTRAFGRQLLGDVRELSAEQLRRLGPDYRVGDVGGQWGLEAAYERTLAGRPRRAVVIRVDGQPTDELLVVPGRRGRDLRTTLDVDVQAAAETALDDLSDDARAALVAVQPSSGDVLAVANRPVDDSFDRALEGQYPPGSTFKVVTAAALLEAGLTRPDAVVGCPTTRAVGGRPFRNFEGGGGAELSFADAFATSCNTAFVGFADRLDPAALPAMAARFGLGARPRLPLPAFGGEVPAPRDLTETAAAMIGQGRDLASPLAMAGAIATVADGSWRPPRLLADDPRVDGTPLDPALTEQLRALTRQVVESGTGTALLSVAGEAHGKSGTAEHGSGDPPPTHAWFVAYRDDVAVAVLVEDGASGGEVAAPVAAAFFAALDAGVTPDALAASE